MATAEELTLVREYINEPTTDNGWTDERITVFVDEADNLLLAAADIWGVKAGTYVGLVNVSESGSSRSLSDLLRQAREMESYYRQRGGALAAETTDVPVIRRISRAR